MKCAWKELLSVLPQWLREPVDTQGSTGLLELRLRLNLPAELVFRMNSTKLHRIMTQDDLNYIVNASSRYSPWAATTLAKGYLTAPGGHRIGVCGEAVVDGHGVSGIRHVRSLCIRVARDFPGLADRLCDLKNSLLILGAPGFGKTTLLRDLIRQRSRNAPVAVVDERGELFPGDFDVGTCTDVLTGCPKIWGIDQLLRTMSPETIAVDEITSSEDCQALLRAGWCGVTLLATAHAASLKDLYSRAIYRPIVDSGIFQHVVVLHSDKSYRTERICG